MEAKHGNADVPRFLFTGQEKIADRQTEKCRKAFDARMRAEALRLYLLPDGMRWDAIEAARKTARSRDSDVARMGELTVAAAAWLYDPRRV